MSLRSAIASIMRSVAAALARAPRLVWDGTKFVLRAAASILPTPPQEEAIAEQELMAELMRPRELPKADTGYEDPHEAWGRAAGDFLVPCGEPLVRPEAVLDERARAYLDALNVMERAALLAYDARHIGQHLLGDRKLKGLPRVPTAAEFTDAEKQRLAALAVPVKAGLAEMQKKVDSVAALMREQGYEPVYEPSFRPRAA
ncbi:hypothetical protein [Methylorubrum extorquens]|jgi:hypothetical protein|uniref:Uncharacterized protein n=1 Tax=Methylorubrum extorquens (strain ATCC 14718 / DSM 1338 / JCM 2805 / NCIMB 9133 / AM1) TaxID=272630 RepID=C5AYJ4_METEA|nr:hypothetical protein [Methylorubrum extorquens]ACS39110.1 Hypothetical protein MexAM1_META1p1246 [Methylorubrum extorquens AM1]MCP1542784.1 hypothetical protein [Methylorubrum extorquens]MCP1589871.1 hypothetical protein [Methylorubrum extorquens]